MAQNIQTKHAVPMNWTVRTSSGFSLNQWLDFLWLISMEEAALCVFCLNRGEKDLWDTTRSLLDSQHCAPFSLYWNKVTVGLTIFTPDLNQPVGSCNVNKEVQTLCVTELDKDGSANTMHMKVGERITPYMNIYKRTMNNNIEFTAQNCTNTTERSAKTAGINPEWLM